MNQNREEKEIINPRANLQNAIVVSFLQLSEARSNLYVGIKFGKDSPAYLESFLYIFRRYFDLTSSLLESKELTKKINKWFLNSDSTKPSKEKGISLSLEWQREVEEGGIIPPIFEESITPPFMVGLEVDKTGKPNEK